jgi:hypothetical protein
MTLWNPAFASPTKGKAHLFGAFQLYRLAQDIVVLWCAAVTPLTVRRTHIIRGILTAVLIVLNISILLDYFGIVATPAYGFALSRNPGIAGPWAWYAASSVPKGVGTVGYNHAYAAAQILLVYLFRSQCDRGRNGAFDTVLMIFTCIVVFLTGSRDGLIACAVVLLGLLFSVNRRLMVSLALTVCLAVGVLVATTRDFGESLQAALQRDATLTTSYEEDGMSGRDVIWAERLAFLNADPMRWVFGTGFGSAIERGNNAHMLPLQVINETGLIGAAIFFAMAVFIVRMLWRFDLGWKPMFWATVAFAIGSAAQETFYPVPAMGHFTAVYLCAVACTIRSAPSGTQSAHVHAVVRKNPDAGLLA